MEILSKITPAETLLIQQGKSVKLKDLLKYTLMDLLLKKVLKLERNNSGNTYVLAGENFKQYKPKSHEARLLQPFKKSNSIKILFKHFVKTMFQKSAGAHYYRMAIKKNQEINDYFKGGFFNNIIGSLALTDQGLKQSRRITHYLNDLDNRIKKWQIKINKEESNIQEEMFEIGGNIFLLKYLDLKQLKEIDREMLNYQKEQSFSRVDDFDMTWFYIDLFDESRNASHFESFDNTFDSADADASGCSSGDSGCSGCSGCGGCGG